MGARKNMATSAALRTAYRQKNVPFSITDYSKLFVQNASMYNLQLSKIFLLSSLIS